MKRKIKDIILENQNVIRKDVFPRNINIPVDTDFIISIIGVRRSGKTYLLYDTVNQLLKKGIKKENIVFINFEDERIQINGDELNIIIEGYMELHPAVKLNDVYFFFDEIQNIEGWQKFIRRIYDTKSKHIFITGSNSKLLSSEIATELRGRTISFEVFPLSFREYLYFIGEVPDLQTETGRSKLISFSEKYILNGGFPAIINIPDDFRVKALQDYFNVMIYRDIVERFKIKDSVLMKFFAKKIFASVTGIFSINKTYNDLKSMGYKVSNNTLYQYIEYFNSIFLIRSVSKFDFSEIKQVKSNKKYYIIDSGLLSAMDFSSSQNYGKLLENQVAMEFTKNNNEIFYYKNDNGYECDFIVKQGSEYIPYQVSWEISDPETKKREIRGLTAAMNELKAKEGTIITFDTEDEIVVNGHKIHQIPFYKMFI